VSERLDRRLAVAEGLLGQPTAPLMEDLPRAHVRAFAAAHGLAADDDPAGNVVVRYEGRHAGDAASRPLVLVAHLDHPGFAVTGGDGEGVDLEFRGGLMADNAVPGAPLDFFAPGRPEPVGRGELVSAAASDNGRLTGATARVVEGAIHPDGFAMWGFPGWSVDDGLVTARCCDDLLGAAAALCALEEIAGRAPDDVAVWGLFTRAEEIGFLGAIDAIGRGVVPEGAAVISLECSKALPDAPQGGGVIVRVGDRMSIFDPDLTGALGRAATQVAATDSRFRWQRKLMDGGACEATAFCAAGYRSSGLALPLGNYHNADDSGPGIAPETVRVDDFHAEVDLLVELGCDPHLLSPAGGGLPEWFTERAGAAREAFGTTDRNGGA
jgi:putative aminopeptidase FrvX